MDKEICTAAQKKAEEEKVKREAQKRKKEEEERKESEEAVRPKQRFRKLYDMLWSSANRTANVTTLIPR